MRKRPSINGALCGSAVLVCLAALAPTNGVAYPPAVGILGPSRNCLTCHPSDGPWKEPASVIIDVLDRSTGKSLRQADGTFLISAKRGELKTVITVIGWRGKGDPAPYRNGWLYVDPKRIADAVSLSKFAPGWAVNLPMSCRLLGDPVEAYPGARVSALPMTLRPGDDAPAETEIELQVMLTRGDSVKGKPDQGMEGNYFERKVRLRVE
jgi:hypothetical protein